MIPSRFEPIWREIVRYDSEPSDRIAVGDESARLKIERSLDHFIGGRPVLVDYPGSVDRPTLFQIPSASGVLDFVESGWEFVVLIADGSAYWAIVEEEYEWLIFERPVGFGHSG